VGPLHHRCVWVACVFVFVYDTCVAYLHLTHTRGHTGPFRLQIFHGGHFFVKVSRRLRSMTPLSPLLRVCLCPTCRPWRVRACLMNRRQTFEVSTHTEFLLVG
jgi:hypothetical protein